MLYIYINKVNNVTMLGLKDKTLLRKFLKKEHSSQFNKDFKEMKDLTIVFICIKHFGALEILILYRKIFLKSTINISTFSSL